MKVLTTESERGGTGPRTEVITHTDRRTGAVTELHLSSECVDVIDFGGAYGKPLGGDHAARKATPIMTGVLDYFPAAIAEVARVSKAGNDQHNPGQPLHWARGKSADHADCAVRHLMERGSFDDDGQRHSAKAAWRALANLQEELEAEGAPLARGGK